MDCCIIEIFDSDKNEQPNISQVIKVIYKGKYIDKYSKIIKNNMVYTKEETNNIFKDNSGGWFTLQTRIEENKGIDIIKELAYLDERIELNFEVLNWNNIEEYKNAITSKGYKFEELTVDEFNEYIANKYGK